MRRNTLGQLFHVVAFNASGRVSGDAANITCTISIDGGTRVTTSDVNPTEIGTTGVYVFTLSQAETDGHELSFIPSSSTSGVQVLGMPSNVIYTSTVDLTANAISAVTDGIDSATPEVSLSSASLSDIAGLATPGRMPGENLPGETRWEVYEGETIEKVFSVYADDDVTKISFTGKSLEIIFSTQSDTVIATVANGDITVSGDDDEIVTFAYPAAATLRNSVLEFTFREDTAPKRVYLQGTLTVKKAKFTAS